MAEMSKRCVLLCVLGFMLLTFVYSDAEENLETFKETHSRYNGNGGGKKTSFLTNTHYQSMSASKFASPAINSDEASELDDEEEGTGEAKEKGVNQMFVFKASIRMQSTNVTMVAERIKRDLYHYQGAFISGSDVENEYAIMTVRVPKDNYHDFLATWTKSNNKNFTVTSVKETATEESANYVDAKTNILTLEAAHKQMAKIMESAKEVKDVLAVQTQLNQIAQKLDAEKAKMKHLQTSIALATVKFMIHRSYGPPKKPPRANRLYTAIVRPLADAQQFYIKFMLGTVSFLVYAVVFSVPFGIALSPLLLCLYRKTRQLYHKRSELLHDTQALWRKWHVSNAPKKNEDEKASV